jgi:hypothetical protein
VLRLRRASRIASLGDRLSLLATLEGRFLTRQRFWTWHAWRCFREAVRGPWEDGFERAAAIVAVNPRLNGMLNSGWMIDPAVRTITPHLAELGEGVRTVGGPARSLRGRQVSARELRPDHPPANAVELGRGAPGSP